MIKMSVPSDVEGALFFWANFDLSGRIMHICFSSKMLISENIICRLIIEK